MADLGELLGSLMTGMIRARRVADEQTAALAEYYKDNPLLEGLSVPRIRIPELTIDMPVLIDNHVEGDAGKIAPSTTIATDAGSQLKSILSKQGIKTNIAFHKTFVNEVKHRVKLVKRTGTPAMKETIARCVQDAFADTLIKTKTTLTTAQKEIIARELRANVSRVSTVKEAVSSSIRANIKTSDVKEQASSASAVRLRITLKEEGLEWTTKAGESGGVVSSLQPE